ncbi:MAG: 30S ribosomal protein S9 [Candidatus Omnitrophica bacterium]|nr:30S ribosomal protein S9 [Candidatus Omnitrophota bacterium]MBD3269433.1 30S ribosomal protein S9 [Candidatus Omnitrophota bacterium]
MAEKENKNKAFTGTGRRKRAVARVRIIPSGKGRITINGKKHDNYFSTVDNRVQVVRPLSVAKMEDSLDVKANVKGGGVSGQAGAVSLGIARCLVQLEPNLRSTLRREDLLTRDPRAKERKKYGRKGARRRFQWTKR